MSPSAIDNETPCQTARLPVSASFHKMKSIFLVGFICSFIANASPFTPQKNLQKPLAAAGPIWPNHFEAMLYKIGDEQPLAQTFWTKFRYFFIENAADPAQNGGFSRFDFHRNYESVVHLNQQHRPWPAECSIVFYPRDFYVIEWNNGTTKCRKRPGVGNLSKYWLRTATFNQTLEFRDVSNVQQWFLGDESTDGIVYYERKEGGKRIPMRSTNQAEDPGATDWFDVIEMSDRVDTSDLKWQELPKSCDEGHTDQTIQCPVSDDFLLAGPHHPMIQMLV